MGIKLEWTGLFFIVGVVPMLKAFGLNPSEVIILVGAIIFGIGCILMWVDR